MSIIVPVYNEGPNIAWFLRELEASVVEPHETLIVHDFPEDNTLPAIAAMRPPAANVRPVLNTLGKGVLNAYKAGFAAAKGDVIVTMVCDRADDPRDVPVLAAMIRSGADVAAASRYMRGGQRIGGPLLGRTLSRVAGLTLCWFAGVPTHDATNNFRAYDRKILRIPIESTASFALGLELILKAHWHGLRIKEVPTIWQDRTAGDSRFRLWAWLPQYLRWYRTGFTHAWIPGSLARWKASHPLAAD